LVATISRIFSRSIFALYWFPEGQGTARPMSNINEFTFNVSDTEEMEYPVMVALGYTSLEAKADFFCDMHRLAGEKFLCGIVSDVVVIGNSTASGGDEVVSDAASN